MSRRSESCPRLPRKDTAPQVPPAPVNPSPRNCTLQDLGPEDRQKVAKLLKQVVDLGQEVQQLKQQRDELMQQAQASTQREQELQAGYETLQKEQQSLKKKLAQVLLVLRASQAKVAALEAAQQAAPRSASCCAEVQTDSVTVVGPDSQTSVGISTTQACGGSSTMLSPHAAAAAAAKPIAGVEPVLPADPAALRTSLSGTPGGPPFLHVAPGAHVNITINHAPEPSSGIASATSAVAAAYIQASKLAEPSVADSSSAAALPCNAGAWCESTAAAAAVATEDCSDAPRCPSPGAVIAIPTTTRATAAGCGVGSVGLAGASTEVVLPEVSTSSCVTTAASARAGPEGQAGDYAGRCTQHAAHGGSDMTCSSARPATEVAAAAVMGQAAVESGSAAMPKAPCAAASAATGQHQSTCRLGGPRSVLVDATMHRFEAVPVHEVRVESRDMLTASPMIVPPSEEVVAAASSLMGWQAQYGYGDGEARPATSSSTPVTGARDPLSSGRKVLSFDPAIGKNGAFYFVDVADVTGEPAGALGFAPGSAAGGLAHAALRPVMSGVAFNRLPDPSPDLQGVSAAPMHVVEHTGLSSPLPSHAPPHGAEATLRPWVDAPTAGGGTTAHRAGVPMVGPQQQQHPHRWHQQQQQQVSERAAPGSPCTSYCTDSTGALTPLSQQPPRAVPHGNAVTPACSTVSLSRMAVALEEVARRQRWDVQPPGSVAQQQQHGQAPGRLAVHPVSAGHTLPQLPGAVSAAAGQFGGQGAEDCATSMKSGPAHADAQGGRKYRDPQGAKGLTFHLLRQGSSGSATAAADWATGTSLPDGLPGGMPHLDSLSACGSTSTWMGGNDVADRYDDSLVDILSQADEEMEQQQQLQVSQQHYHRSRQQPRLQPQRQQMHAGAFATTAVPARPRGMPAAMKATSGAAPEWVKLQAASAEALLAANLYEENDVLSVILEQEGRS